MRPNCSANTVPDLPDLDWATDVDPDLERAFADKSRLAVANADLLIAADCSAYAYGNFHGDFIDGKITLMGCPKLDMVDYSEKLTELFTRNTIRSITRTRMEVPCCGGLEYAVKQAVAASGKDIPLKVVTIGINGDLK